MTAPQPTLSTFGGVRLVAEREIRMRLRSKAFIISWAILLLVIVASVVLPPLFASNAEGTRVAAVGDAVAVASAVDGLEVTEASDRSHAEKLVTDEEVEAALVPSDSPTGLEILALDSPPLDLVTALSVSPEVTLLAPSDQNPMLVYFVALGFGLIFFMAALTFGSIIAQSVVEEKSTRVVEILMAAIPARTLMAGKILGNSVLAFAQVLTIAIAVGIGLLAGGQDILLADIGAPIVWFIVFFAFGFVLVAAMFAATGAMVSRQEDIGSTTTPVTMLVMAPYFLIIFFHDNPLILSIMSYVPFSAPVGMPMRVFLGAAEWWEPLLSLGVLVATTLLVIGLASRIYSNSLLKTGSRVTFKEALRG